MPRAIARPSPAHDLARKQVLGVDSDNDSGFMSQSVFDYWKAHGLVQTRSRAYNKNDQAWDCGLII